MWHIYIQLLKLCFQNIIYNKLFINSDDSALSDEPDEPDDSAPVLPERNMRGPPTNKNIPVRNIKAQIANMSAKENAGFKSEYNVRHVC